MSGEIEVVELMHRLYKKLMKRMAPLFRDQQLSMTEVTLLWRVGQQPGIRASDLATDLGMAGSTLTGLTDRMVAQGYLERVADPNDRRSVRLNPTAKAETAKLERQEMVDTILREAFQCLPAERQEQMAADLQKVMDHLDLTEGDTLGE